MKLFYKACSFLSIFFSMDSNIKLETSCSLSLCLLIFVYVSVLFSSSVCLDDIQQ